MAKTRQQKEQLLTSLEDKLARAKVAVLLKYQGLKVKDSESLRGKLRDLQMDMVVPKNSVAKIALKNAGIEVSGEAFTQPLALIFGYADEVGPAKEIVLFGKTFEALEILGGILDKKMVSAEVIKSLAKLPSREELMGQLAGSLSAPARGLATSISGVARGLVTALNAVKSQKTA